MKTLAGKAFGDVTTDTGTRADDQTDGFASDNSLAIRSNVVLMGANFRTALSRLRFDTRTPSLTKVNIAASSAARGAAQLALRRQATPW